MGTGTTVLKAVNYIDFEANTDLNPSSSTAFLATIQPATPFTSDCSTINNFRLTDTPNNSPILEDEDDNLNAKANITYANAANIFDIYPNPLSGSNVNIYLGKPGTADVLITILNALGEEVYVKKYTQTSLTHFSLDLGAVSPGVYIAKVKTGNEIGIKKFVIN